MTTPRRSRRISGFSPIKTKAFDALITPSAKTPKRTYSDRKVLNFSPIQTRSIRRTKSSVPRAATAKKVSLKNKTRLKKSVRTVKSAKKPVRSQRKTTPKKKTVRSLKKSKTVATKSKTTSVKKRKTPIRSHTRTSPVQTRSRVRTTPRRRTKVVKATVTLAKSENNTKKNKKVATLPVIESYLEKTPTVKESDPDYTPSNDMSSSDSLSTDANTYTPQVLRFKHLPSRFQNIPVTTLDYKILIVLTCIIALYIAGMVRSSGYLKVAGFSTKDLQFDALSLGTLSFVLYLAATKLCQVWCKGWTSTDNNNSDTVLLERSYLMLHFVHSLFVLVHLISCYLVSKNEQIQMCSTSIISLSAGFYISQVMYFKGLSISGFRDILIIVYVIMFHQYGEGVLNLVISLAIKGLVSLIWACFHMKSAPIGSDMWMWMDLGSTISFAVVSMFIPSEWFASVCMG